MSILIVGSLAYDDIITPFASRRNCLGGSAIYFSLAARHFAQVEVVGVVGEDFRASDRRMLAELGIGMTGVETAPGRTFTWKGEYLANWNDRVTHETKLNVFEHFDPQLPEQLRSCSHVFLGNIDPVLQSKVLDQVKGRPFVALDTMNYWINNHRAALLKTLTRIDLLVVNDSEALMLSGERHLVDAARTILTMGPSTLVIKRGEHGALLVDATRVFVAPAYPMCRVLDPTGAGDAFAGGLFGYLHRSACTDFAHLRRAVIQGSVLGSIAVESFSVESLAALHPQNVEARYREFVEMTHFEPQGGSIS